MAESYQSQWRTAAASHLGSFLLMRHVALHVINVVYWICLTLRLDRSVRVPFINATEVGIGAPTRQLADFFAM